jgi:putative transposase
MQNKLEILSPESTYHVYNRANGSEKLFRSSDNYYYFLNQYFTFISPIADTFCYCLMPNHFHFLIRIKKITELPIEDLLGSKNLTGFQNLSGLAKEELISIRLSRQFGNFFNSYSKAINKQLNRKGSLFMRPYKRILVKDEKYLKKLVHYIHHNPVKDNLCPKPEDWTFSSYLSIIQNKNIFFNASEVISWFDDLENFKAFHKLSPQLVDVE